jgi:hypothetical protein
MTLSASSSSAIGTLLSLLFALARHCRGIQFTNPHCLHVSQFLGVPNHRRKRVLPKPRCRGLRASSVVSFRVLQDLYVP